MNIFPVLIKSVTLRKGDNSNVQTTHFLHKSKTDFWGSHYLWQCKYFLSDHILDSPYISFEQILKKRRQSENLNRTQFVPKIPPPYICTFRFLFILFYRVSLKKGTFLIFVLFLFQKSYFTFSHVVWNQTFEPV